MPMFRKKNTFCFRFVVKIECLKTFLALEKLKPLGPSTIPSRALRDAASELAEPICFLLNEFIKEKHSLQISKEPTSVHFLKKETLMIL